GDERAEREARTGRADEVAEEDGRERHEGGDQPEPVGGREVSVTGRVQDAGAFGGPGNQPGVRERMARQGARERQADNGHRTRGWRRAHLVYRTGAADVRGNGGPVDAGR